MSGSAMATSSVACSSVTGKPFATDQSGGNAGLNDLPRGQGQLGIPLVLRSIPSERMANT
jgi:hypothetical protein